MAVIGEGLTYGYWPIDLAKSYETDDGLMVYGKAAGPGLDLDKQRFSAEYLKSAVPEWFKWANVREQHQQIAAGVGHELEEKGNGEYWVKALIVDPVTIKKVKTKVLKGFSPGIRNGRVRKSASAPNGEIWAGDMIELSLVDRPSDPTNGITICKSAGGKLFLPTNADGDELSFETRSVPVKWLTEDMHKSASATALDVLNGEYDESDAETTAAAIVELADLQIAELMMLKSAGLDGGYDISGLVNAHNAMLAFVDEPGYPEMEADFADLEKSAGVDGAMSSTMVDNLVKAAVAEVTKSFGAQVEALTEEVARLRATPVSGGAPVTLPPRNRPAVTKPAETGIDYIAKAASVKATDPQLASVYLKLAQKEGAKTS